jgi:hypothetical protein
MFIDQNNTIVVLDQVLYVANVNGSNGSRSKPSSKDWKKFVKKIDKFKMKIYCNYYQQKGCSQRKHEKKKKGWKV